MEMVASGDKVHTDAYGSNESQHMTMTPEAQKEWMDKFHADFAAQPEDR